MGFAEGFRSGFGLISDVKDRELQRDRLEEQARQGDLDREATSAYRAEQNRLAGDRNAIAQTEADSQATYREGQLTNQAELNKIRKQEAKNKGIELGLEKTRINADAALKGAQTSTITDSLQLKIDRRSQRESAVGASLAVQKFTELADQVRSGEIAYTEEVKGQLASLSQQTEGSLLDLNYVTNPNTQYQSQRLQGVLQQIQQGNFEGIDQTALRDTFNVMLRSNNMSGIGEEVTSRTHPSAGSFADKGYVVVGKQVSSLDYSDNSLGLKVDVLIKNPETGESFTYEAPMTVGRKSTGEGVELSVEEAVQAAGGFFQYANSMAPYTSILTDINKKKYDLTEGRSDGDFDMLVNKSMENARSASTRDPDSESPISGMTMKQFAGNPAVMRTYYNSSLANPESMTESSTIAGDTTYNLMADSNPIRVLEKLRGGKKLSRAQILEAAQFLSVDENTGAITIDDEKEWRDWKNGVLGRATNRSSNLTGTYGGYNFDAVD